MGWKGVFLDPSRPSSPTLIPQRASVCMEIDRAREVPAALRGLICDQPRALPDAANSTLRVPCPGFVIIAPIGSPHQWRRRSRCIRNVRHHQRHGRKSRGDTLQLRCEPAACRPSAFSGPSL